MAVPFPKIDTYDKARPYGLYWPLKSHLSAAFLYVAALAYYAQMFIL